MITDNSKILIVNIMPNLKDQNNSLWRTSGELAPLGIFNVAEIYPNNTEIVSIEIEKLSKFIEEKEIKIFNFILIKFTSDIDLKKLSKLAIKFKLYNPKLVICIVGKCKASVKNFDITCFGTGIVLIKNILNRPILKKGFINTLHEDMQHKSLPISNFDNINNLPAISNIEKSLSKQTIEVMQPWAGFLDDAYIPELLDVDQNWFNKLLIKLKNRGFSGFHINLKHWDFSLIDQINTFCMASETEFSVYCENYNINNIMALKGSKLKRIWIPYNNCVKDLILEIKQANIETGLELTNTRIIDKQDIRIINYADRYCFKDLRTVNKKMLRMITFKFWSYKNRYIKRLFQLSTMSKLIDFLKLSYTIIEILLINKGK